MKEAQSRGFKLIRELHKDSQNSGQGKTLIDVIVMKENFSRFLDSLVDVSASSTNRATKLQKLSRYIHMATKELPK